MNDLPRKCIALVGLLVAFGACDHLSLAAQAPNASFAGVIERTRPKIVKIYGAGGYRGLESYQSGFLISPEGHVLTVWSYVLDSDVITVTLDDGRKFEAKLLAADPRLELAVLKVEAQGLPAFDLGQSVEASEGMRVLAFSNLFGVATGDEPVSVQHGSVAACTKLEARRGTYETPYKGPVFVLDAMTNNPGAAGGALTDRDGRLLGMLGKELRNSLTNIWLNYAIPTREMATTVEEIRAGRFVAQRAAPDAPKPAHPLTLDLLGIVVVPEVLDRTPPFIDEVRIGSPAAEAGLKPDDLIVFVGERLVPTSKALRDELERIDRIDRVKLTVTRGQDLIEVTLTASDAEN
jgi:serine protease Do